MTSPFAGHSRSRRSSIPVVDGRHTTRTHTKPHSGPTERSMPTPRTRSQDTKKRRPLVLTERPLHSRSRLSVELIADRARSFKIAECTVSPGRPGGFLMPWSAETMPGVAASDMPCAAPPIGPITAAPATRFRRDARFASQRSRGAPSPARRASTDSRAGPGDGGRGSVSRNEISEKKLGVVDGGGARGGRRARGGDSRRGAGAKGGGCRERGGARGGGAAQ